MIIDPDVNDGNFSIETFGENLNLISIDLDESKRFMIPQEYCDNEVKGRGLQLNSSCTLITPRKPCFPYSKRFSIVLKFWLYLPKNFFLHFKGIRIDPLISKCHSSYIRFSVVFRDNGKKRFNDVSVE